MADVNYQIQSFFSKFSLPSFPGSLKLVQAYHLWKSGDPARLWECRQLPVPEAVQATRLKTHRESDELRKWRGIRSVAWGWIGGWWLNSIIRGGWSQRYREYFWQWMHIKGLCLNQGSQCRGFAVVAMMNWSFRAATNRATIQSSIPEHRIDNDWSVLDGSGFRLVPALVGWHWSSSALVWFSSPSSDQSSEGFLRMFKAASNARETYLDKSSEVLTLEAWILDAWICLGWILSKQWWCGVVLVLPDQDLWSCSGWSHQSWPIMSISVNAICKGLFLSASSLKSVLLSKWCLLSRVRFRRKWLLENVFPCIFCRCRGWNSECCDASGNVQMAAMCHGNPWWICNSYRWWWFHPDHSFCKTLQAGKEIFDAVPEAWPLGQQGLAWSWVEFL